jgi:hypothetical protein
MSTVAASRYYRLAQRAKPPGPAAAHQAIASRIGSHQHRAGLQTEMRHCLVLDHGDQAIGGFCERDRESAAFRPRSAAGLSDGSERCYIQI